MIIALDLDETLVRVSCAGVHKRTLDNVDFSMSVSVGADEAAQVFECGVSVRPGLDRFFKWLQEHQAAGRIEGPWVFTTATPAFTKALLKQLDPSGRIIGLRVLTRSYCEMPKMPGFFLKDLDRIPSEAGHKSRKVLVDNSPISHVLNPQSAVLVRDYLANGQSDDGELARVADLLDGVIQAHNDEWTPEGSGDYATYLSRVPGHDQLHERLGALREKLDNPGLVEASALRQAMRSASADCNEMKRELLGSAP